MGKIYFSVQGLKELEANSEKIKKEANKAASDSVLKQAEMVQAAIRQKAPGGPTGNLKRGVVAGMMPDKPQYPPIAIVAMDWKIAPHAHMVEYGTSVRRPKRKEIMVGKKTGVIYGKEAAPMPAHPFFRRGWDECKYKVKENLKNDIKSGIEGAV